MEEVLARALRSLSLMPLSVLTAPLCLSLLALSNLLWGARVEVATASYKECISCEHALGPIGIFHHKCHVPWCVAGGVEHPCDEKVETHVSHVTPRPKNRNSKTECTHRLVYKADIKTSDRPILRAPTITLSPSPTSRVTAAALSPLPPTTSMPGHIFTCHPLSSRNQQRTSSS
jgi:hypothetical protein